MKNFTKRGSFFLSIVAILAILWFVFSSLELITRWWALPAIAAFTGILSIVIPSLAKRFRPFASVISVGWAILLYLTILPFTASKLLALTIIIFIIAIITEILTNSGLHIGSLLLDLLISAVTAWLLTKLSFTCLGTLLGLLDCYLVVLLIDFDFSFSIKKRNTNEEDDNNTEE